VWKIAAIVFSVAFVLAPVVIEILRSVVHERRERVNGLGGTQDIAMWGTLAALACGALAAVCWGMWYASE
jgi:hypothetical protein